MSIVKNLYRNYGDFVLSIEEMRFSAEGVTGLWGPSGSGKTSTLRTLLGLEPCPGLSWVFPQGIDVAKLSVREKQLGVVFQSLELFPHMTAQENILFAAKARKIADWKSLLNNFVEKLELGKFLNRPVKVLSGGEKQRVALARALIGKPRFLFLDEPFSSLDSHLRSEARQLVKGVLNELKTPALLITHDENDLEEVCDQVIELRNGKVLSSP